MVRQHLRRYHIGSDTSRAVPVDIIGILQRAKTPKEIEKLIQEHGDQLCKALRSGFISINRESGVKTSFFNCETAADLMEQVLDARHIDHTEVEGFNDNDEPHVGVEVAGKVYDPSGQGFHRERASGFLTPEEEEELTRYMREKGTWV